MNIEGVWPSLACSPISRRQFLCLGAFTLGAAFSPRWLWPAPPASLGMTSACQASSLEVLGLLATAEALALTLYYQATQSEFFIRLPTPLQDYVRALLDQERQHSQLLAHMGASSHATQFYTPPSLFGFDDFPHFLTTLESLEQLLIDGYLAAMRRFAELGEPALVVAAGQFVGVEAEHRVVVRELVGDSPPPPNNLCFERTTLDCVSLLMDRLEPYLHGQAGWDGPIATPSSAEVEAAVGAVRCAPIPLAAPALCDTTPGQIVSIAAAAEALAITFYYHGIRGGFFGRLSAARQWYLQAALDEERVHLDFLLAHGAATPPVQFYFPDTVFDDLPLFLDTLDWLENAFIAAYLAATQRFGRLGLPILAQIAGQILGVEAEHRVLGRFIAQRQPPHDRCLSTAPLACVEDAVTVLAPFLQGGEGYALVKPMPTTTDINAAVSRFGCARVETGAYHVYLPHIATGRSAPR